MHALHACSSLAAEMGLSVAALREAASSEAARAQSPSDVEALADSLMTTRGAPRTKPFTLFCATWHPALARLISDDNDDFAAAWNLADYVLVTDARITDALEEVAAQHVLRTHSPPLGLSSQQTEQMRRRVARIEHDTTMYPDMSQGDERLRRHPVTLRNVTDASIAALWGHFGAIRMYWTVNYDYPAAVWRIQKTAALGGHLDVLQWIHARKQLRMNEEMCDAAAAGGHVDVLQWLRVSGCPWGWDACIEAARYGQLAALQWCHENGAPWDARVCAVAAERGHLAVLQWARSASCHWWPDSICEDAIFGMHADVLDWLRAQGSPCVCNFDDSVVRKWAMSLELVQWVHAHGVPWGNLCRRLAYEGHLDMLEWARAHGAQVDEWTWGVKQSDGCVAMVVRRPVFHGMHGMNA